MTCEMNVQAIESSHTQHTSCRTGCRSHYGLKSLRTSTAYMRWHMNGNVGRDVCVTHMHAPGCWCALFTINSILSHVNAPGHLPVTWASNPCHTGPRSEARQISPHILSEIHSDAGLALLSSPIATPPVIKKRNSAELMVWASSFSLVASTRANNSLSFSNNDLNAAKPQVEHDTKQYTALNRAGAGHVTFFAVLVLLLMIVQHPELVKQYGNNRSVSMSAVCCTVATMAALTCRHSGTGRM